MPLKAENDIWVWLVIMAIVGISKLIAKAKEFSASAPSADAEPPPPRPPPRPAVQRPGTRVPHLPSSRVAQPQGPRRVEPMRRIATTEAESPSVGQPAVPRKNWNVSLDDLQTFLERMQAPAQRPPIAPVPPPLVETVAPAPAPPVPKAEEPPPAAPVKETLPTTVASTRAALWNQALRDKTNLRNVILSVEILGPPRALRPLER